jgi:hypothetical protein
MEKKDSLQIDMIDEPAQDDPSNRDLLSFQSKYLTHKQPNMQ